MDQNFRMVMSQLQVVYIIISPTVWDHIPLDWKLCCTSIHFVQEPVSLGWFHASTNLILLQQNSGVTRMTCGVVVIIVLVSLTNSRHFWLEGLQWWTTCFVGSTFLAKPSAVGRKRKYHKVNYAIKNCLG